MQEYVRQGRGAWHFSIVSCDIKYGKARYGSYRNRRKEITEDRMELYQFDCVLHEPREDQGWLYMAEIPELPGCRAWADTPNDALTELSTVAEHFILSYRDRGKPLPAGIAQSETGQGKISIAL